MVKIIFAVPPESKRIDSDIIGRRYHPHIGLAYLKASLQKNGIYDIAIIDAPVEKLTHKKFKERIIELKPDIVGLTATTPQINDASIAAHAIKQVDKDIATIIGGVHVNNLPKETLQEFPYFDFSVYGEGEKTICELIDKIKSGNNDFLSVKGLAYKINNKVKVNPPRGVIENVDELPFPDFEGFPLDKYTPFHSVKKGIVELPLMTARGCPYKCIFCCRPTGNKPRLRSVESVIMEIERDIEKFNARRIVFLDDTFILSKERILNICNEMIERGISKSVTWITETRVDSVDKEILQKMKEAGCRLIMYGIESGNQKCLNNLKKGTTLEQARTAVKLTKEAKIEVDTNFILGCPNETYETILDTIDFALELDPDYAGFSIMTPFPGTEVRKIIGQNKGKFRLLTSDWKKYGKQIGEAMELENIDRRCLESLQTLAYIKFYLRPHRLFNLFKQVGLNDLMKYFLYNLLKKIKQ